MEHHIPYIYILILRYLAFQSNKFSVLSAYFSGTLIQVAAAHEEGGRNMERMWCIL